MQFPCFPPQHHSPQKMNSTEDDLPPPPPELTRQPEVVAPVNDRPTVSVHTVHRAPPLSSATYEKELPPPVSLRSVVRLCFFFLSLLSVWCLCRILPPTPLPPHTAPPHIVLWVDVLPFDSSSVMPLWVSPFGCGKSVGYCPYPPVESCEVLSLGVTYLWGIDPR